KSYPRNHATQNPAAAPFPDSFDWIATEKRFLNHRRSCNHEKTIPERLVEDWVHLACIDLHMQHRENHPPDEDNARTHKHACYDPQPNVQPSGRHKANGRKGSVLHNQHIRAHRNEEPPPHYPGAPELAEKPPAPSTNW